MSTSLDILENTALSKELENTWELQLLTTAQFGSSWFIFFLVRSFVLYMLFYAFTF